MRDIEGEEMWNGYLINEADRNKGRYPNIYKMFSLYIEQRAEDMPHLGQPINPDKRWKGVERQAPLSQLTSNEFQGLLTAMIQSVHMGKKEWAVQYANQLADNYDIELMNLTDTIARDLEKVGADEQEVQVFRDKAKSDQPQGLQEDDVEQPQEPAYEQMDTQEYQNLSPEQIQAAIKHLAELDIAYQHHNFAFTDPEQRAKIDNVRGRLKILRDLAKTPEQREQEAAKAAAEEKAREASRAKRYPHTGGKRPLPRDINDKKREFRADGTFEKLGTQLPEDSKARRSNNTFGPMGSEGDGDIIGSVQSAIVSKWFTTGDLPDMDKLIQELELYGRL